MIMNYLYKFFWTLRYFVFKLVLGKCKGIGYLGKPIFICGPKNIILGKNTRILPNWRMETHNKGIINIGNNVSAGQGLHITSSVNQLSIGDGTIISANVCITNIDHDYSNINESIAIQQLLPSETRLGQNCFIGFGVMIQAGSILGKHCIVGANSVVKGTFPDYCVIVGSPAKVVKKFCFEKKCWIKV